MILYLKGGVGRRKVEVFHRGEYERKVHSQRSAVAPNGKTQERSEVLV